MIVETWREEVSKMIGNIILQNEGDTVHSLRRKIDLEYKRLHSDKRGEIADRNWQRRLTIKGGFR